MTTYWIHTALLLLGFFIVGLLLGKFLRKLFCRPVKRIDYGMNKEKDSEYRQPNYGLPEVEDGRTPHLSAAAGTVAAGAAGLGAAMTMDKPDVDVSELDLPGAHIATPDMPDADLPPVLVDKPETELEISTPDVDADLPEAGFPGTRFADFTMKEPEIDANMSLRDVDMPAADIDVPDVDIDASMPSASVDAPEMQDVDVRTPDVDLDMNLPVAEIDVPDIDVQAPDIDTDVSLPDIEAGSEGLGLGNIAKGIAATASAGAAGVGVSLFSKKADADADLPAVDVDTADMGFEADFPDIDASIPDVNLDADLPDADVSVADVSLGTDLPDVDVETPDLGLEAGFSDVDARIPEVNLDEGLPDMDADTPDVGFEADFPNVDASIPKADRDVDSPGVDVKASDSDIEMTTPQIKLPTTSDGELSAPDFDALDENIANTNLAAEASEVESKVSAADVDWPEVKVLSDDGSVESVLGGATAAAATGAVVAAGLSGAADGSADNTADDSRDRQAMMELIQHEMQLPATGAAVRVKVLELDGCSCDGLGLNAENEITLMAGGKGRLGTVPCGVSTAEMVLVDGKRSIIDSGQLALFIDAGIVVCRQDDDYTFFTL